ncbi:MAG: hypothetical protein GF417_03230 [Candidatus Latescibacteria bacterium]|nr:hypothetical protein [bacterium]MBD3423442.1 hypothetical protein [Candidatus Latescibacterota bacterium]
MEIIFIYNRLYSITRKQLEAIREKDYELIEELTAEREKLTGRICSILEYQNGKFGNRVIERKVREITELVLDVDEDIKNALMNELMEKTLEIQNLNLVKE